MNADRLLVTDADNTLWETDAVYARAQLDLLRRVEQSFHFTSDSPDRLAFVRRIDQDLARWHPLGLRYPPQLLVHAIAARGAGTDTSAQLMGANPSEYDPRVNKIAADFLAQVSDEVPILRPGVSNTLPRLAASGVNIVVFTEGDPNRCEAYSVAHDLKRCILSITAARKTVESYETMLRANRSAGDPIMVGDQLDRDIIMAQSAGFRGVYFPGSFEPEWVRTVQATPDYVISSFSEILEIVH